MSSQNPSEFDPPFSTAEGGRWTSEGNGKPHPATEAFAHLRAHFNELLAYINHYTTAKVDGVKITLRNAILWTVVGVLAAFVAAALLVTACVLLLLGLGGAISATLHTGPWAGDLIISVLVLSAMALGIWLGIRKMTRWKREQLVMHYERRQEQQRSDFGHDARERAEQAADNQ